MTDRGAWPPSTAAVALDGGPDFVKSLAMSIADLRKDYARHSLDESSVKPEPLEQFRVWLDEALASQLPEPTAVALCTVGADGRPSSRMVLLKSVDTGFVFYTNYESRKGRELAANEHACLLFFWPELERQVRVEGTVAPVSAEESDAYYRSRPLPSRIGAWASPQSQPLSSAALMARVAEAALKHGLDPNRPPHWGGYRLTADRLELWQGRPSRLHDRVVYVRDGERWTITRLAP
jgi:pyridoxamine 5'-phosphate oxidase